MEVRNILVDGLQVATTDAGEAAIKKLQGQLQAATDAAAATDTAHAHELQEAKDAAAATIAEKDAALATKDAEIAELKGKVLDDAAIDARVAEKAATVAKARAFASDADFSGKSDTEIKALAVDAHYGAGTSDGKPDAYINTAFDLLKVPQGTGDPVRDAILGSKPAADTKVDDHGYAAYVASLNGGDAATKGE